MGFLEDLLGYRDIRNGLALLPRRKQFRVDGAGITATDDPVNDATVLSVPGTALPAGADTQVQYNALGVLAGSASFTWDDFLKRLAISGYQAIAGDGLNTPLQISNTGAAGTPVQSWTRPGAIANYHVGVIDPNGTVSGAAGALFHRVDAGTPADSDLYINTDGATAWSSLRSGHIASRTFVVDSGATPSSTVYNTLAAALAAKPAAGITHIQQMTGEVTGAVPLDFTNVVWCSGSPDVVVDLSASTAVGLPPLEIGEGLRILYANALPFWTVSTTHTIRVRGSGQLGQTLNIAGPGHLFDVTATGALGFITHAAILTGKVHTVATGGSVVFFSEGGDLGQDYDGDPAMYFLGLADGALLNPAAPATIVPRRLDSLLSVAVNFSAPAIPNLLGHVDTLAGAFTGTMPDPSLGNDWQSGQSALFVDSALNAATNPFTIATTAGGVVDLAEYKLNKAGDSAWLFPSNPFTTNRFNLLTFYPRFEGEFVVEAVATKNEFETIDAMFGVTAGYPGTKRVTTTGGITDGSARDWTDHAIVGGPWTFGAASSWTSPPALLEDASLVIDATLVTGLTSVFPAVRRSTITNVGSLVTGFLHNTAGTVELHLYDATLAGSATEGLFKVDHASAVLVVHLYGRGSVSAQTFNRGAAGGTVEVICHDPEIPVLTQTLVPAVNIDVHQARIGVEDRTAVDTTTASTSFVGLHSVTFTAPHEGDYLVTLCVSATNTQSTETFAARMLVDAVANFGLGASQGPIGWPSSLSGTAVVRLDRGSHTITSEWKVSAGTGRIRPVGNPGEESALLTVVQL